MGKGIIFLFLGIIILSAFASADGFEYDSPSASFGFNSPSAISTIKTYNINNTYFNSTVINGSSFNATYDAKNTSQWLLIGNNISNRNSGGVSIGSNSSEFKLTIDKDAASPDGGILSIGTIGAGADLITSGGGTRMFWYPKKAAFRAGLVSGGEWDDIRIGDFSAAFGTDTQAIGANSIAMGKGTIASGTISTAFGSGTRATGDLSTAFGQASSAGGIGSTALGGFLRVTGDNSVGIGLESISSGATVTLSNVMSIFGGNVGIGTTDPVTMLDVNGNLSTLGFFMPTGASNGFVLTSNGSGFGTWQVSSSGNSTFNQTLTDLLYQPKGANVSLSNLLTQNTTWFSLLLGSLNNASYLSTFNATYDGFTAFNLTNFRNNLTDTDCAAGQLVIGVQANGTVLCATDVTTGGATRSFNETDSDVSTTSSTTFNQTIMTLAVAANKNYTLNCRILTVTGAAATGIQINMTVPATPTFFAGTYRDSASPTADFVCAGTAESCASLATTGSTTFAYVDVGARIINDGSSGSLKLAFRSETGTLVTVKQGSHCVMYDDN